MCCFSELKQDFFLEGYIETIEILKHRCMNKYIFLEKRGFSFHRIFWDIAKILSFDTTQNHLIYYVSKIA